MDLTLHLNSVSSLRFIQYLILSVQPKSNSFCTNTSGMEFNLPVILSFHSLGTGEFPKSKLSFHL